MTDDTSQAFSPQDADQPIVRRDQDLLGRSPLANRIAEAIVAWSGQSSIVVGVHGEWGSGKSSILNMALERLVELSADGATEKPPIVLHFRPWTYSTPNEIVFAFFNSLSRVLDRKDAGEAAKKAAKGLRTYSLALAPLQYGLGILIPQAGAVVGAARNMIDRSGTAMDEAADLAAKDIEAIKADINNLLSEQGQLIVVVMDDIDRLSHDEIRQLFQLVKANADFSHLLYLMAFDQATVADALLPVYGPRYLEKVVQVQIQIPEPNQELMLDALYERLDVLRDDVGAEYTRESFLNVFRRGPETWIRNMRDVSRYLNAVAFSLPLAKDEVHIPEFMAVEAMRMFRPQVYSALQAFRPYLLNEAGDRTGEEPGWFARFKTDCGDEWSSSRRVLEYLLPGIEQALASGTIHWGEEAEVQWLKEKRLRSAEYFRRYFQLSVDPGEMTEAEFRASFDTIEDEEAFGEHALRMVEDRKLVQWLRRIHSHASDVNDSSRAAYALLRIGDLTEPRSSMTNLVVAVAAILEPLTPGERGSIIDRAIEDNCDAEVLDRLIAFEGTERHGSSALNGAEIDFLQARLLTRLEHEAEAGTLIAAPHFPEIAWSLYNHGKRDLVRSVLAAAAKEDIKLPVVLDVLVTDSYVGQPDSLFPKWQPKMAQQASEVIDLSDIQARLRSLSTSDLAAFDERHRAMVQYVIEFESDESDVPGVQ